MIEYSKSFYFLDKHLFLFTMPAKMTFSVFDNVNNKKADGLKYDLWRINDNTNRVNIKQDTITDDNQHVLVQANTNEDLGSYEVVLYIKDYYKQNNPDIDVQDSRMTVPFGVNDLNQDYHLNVHITPTTVTCTL